MILALMPAERLAAGTQDSVAIFDQYGMTQWEDEQARLDNFAVQLMNDPELIGYILIYD